MSDARDSLTIKSHKGEYTASFIADPFEKLSELSKQDIVVVIDKKVLSLYKSDIDKSLGKNRIYAIEATEDNKDLAKMSKYILDLMNLQIKRTTTLVVIGGGILQDISCFISAVLFRGLEWVYFPTTLLAQADSCIGSKSSINVSGVKNLVGTFTPPREVFISESFLKTLNEAEILSGRGEMIKVHGIAGIESFRDFALHYDQLATEPGIFRKYLLNSLKIKKRIIELDEFDRGPRLVMNYGHTFGHAIESATHYEMPHGIAITVGQSMACHYARQESKISQEVFETCETVMKKNMGNAKSIKINFEKFMESISRDKKNVGSCVSLIVPINDQLKIEKISVELDQGFRDFCLNYFKGNTFYVE